MIRSTVNNTSHVGDKEAEKTVKGDKEGENTVDGRQGGKKTVDGKQGSREDCRRETRRERRLWMGDKEGETTVDGRQGGREETEKDRYFGNKPMCPMSPARDQYIMSKVNVLKIPPRV